MDGKARYEGIESFLKANGINIPYGQPDDPPDELARLGCRIRYRQASWCLDASHEVLNVRVVHCPIEPVRIAFGKRGITRKRRWWGDRSDFGRPYSAFC